MQSQAFILQEQPMLPSPSVPADPTVSGPPSIITATELSIDHHCTGASGSSSTRTAPTFHSQSTLSQGKRQDHSYSGPGSGATPSNKDIDPPSNNIVTMPSAIADVFSPSCLQRPASPTPTVDFSIIDVDIETFPSAPYQPESSHGIYSTRSRATVSPATGIRHSPSTSLAFPFGSRRGFHSTPSLSLGGDALDDPAVGSASQATYPGDLATPIEDHYDFFDHTGNALSPNSLKALLPRLWEVLSSPGKSIFLNVTSPSSPSPTSFSASSSSFSSSVRHPFTGGGTFPRWKGKGKAKAAASIPDWRSDITDESFLDCSDLSPLDGEEGELIDDEACFIDVRAVTGIDILSLLPTELALQILILLCAPLSPVTRPVASSTDFESYPYPLPDPDALRSILSCLAVSRKWRALASDNSVWQALFIGRWAIDLRRANGLLRSARQRCTKLARVESKPLQLDSAHSIDQKSSRRPTEEFSSPQSLSMSWPVVQRSTPRLVSPRNAPLQLNWLRLYRERFELEKRWSGHTHPTKSAIRFSDEMHGFPQFSNFDPKLKWEPKVTRIAGHNDSVYCLEFDSQRIITGSRDRTIKVWSLRTGRLLGTFWGVHNGSVLCLKFEHDWDQGWDDLENPMEGRRDPTSLQQTVFHEISNQLRYKENSYPEQFPTIAIKAKKRGLMVSGSSDCSICVWDIWTGRPLFDDGLVGSDDKETHAEVRAILKGHVGGVLDIKLDKKWIVSCSKDAVVRVWDRNTLEPHKILRGHEGPVNAVGLQNGRVVSASGDGKMILWDVESGERLRTFEGHDRGLACIEFRGDLIISGSNDCKIKVWSASTGECLRTLIGHDALVRALSFDPRNGRLVSASYDKTVKLWDLRTGKLMSSFTAKHSSHIFDVKLDVSRIVSTSHDRHIVVLDFSHGLDGSLFV